VFQPILSKLFPPSSCSYIYALFRKSYSIAKYKQSKHHTINFEDTKGYRLFCEFLSASCSCVSVIDCGGVSNPQTSRLYGQKEGGDSRV